jgi:3-hydroxy-9,10-secoandrosta-1,3,5(10)-triene-9,17-dione monooxygenase reductase component
MARSYRDAEPNMTAEVSNPVTPDPAAIVELPRPAAMRRALGLFASGVTIITGLDEEEPVGFACQAFSSVSLDPPLILFCADHSGRSWPRIRKSGRFSVHVLGEEQTDLCGRFASKAARKFEGLDWGLSRWSTPALAGVLLRVDAEIQDIHLAGDHDVVIGLVREIEHGDPRPPLVFYRGTFGLEHEIPQALLPPGLWGWADDWG